jgi:hypothetical protein
MSAFGPNFFDIGQRRRPRLTPLPKSEVGWASILRTIPPRTFRSRYFARSASSLIARSMPEKIMA